MSVDKFFGDIHWQILLTKLLMFCVLVFSYDPSTHTVHHKALQKSVDATGHFTPQVTLAPTITDISTSSMNRHQMGMFQDGNACVKTEKVLL